MARFGNRGLNEVQKLNTDYRIPKITTVNQALIDEIVTSVLAQLQPAPVRQISHTAKTAAAGFPATNAVARPVIAAAMAPVSVAPSPVPVPAIASPTFVELMVPIITADVLEKSVRPGQPLRIGRNSILTPSARDWLHSKRTSWTRQDKSNSSGSGPRGKWQIILQTVTPTIRSLQDGIRRLADGWKIELVGQPLEAAVLATNLISTAECDGVVIFTEQAELIACKANRHDRVRAAVMQNSKQWEHVMRTLSANVVCISPVGRTFIELRNLLRDCAGSRPRSPAGL